MNSSNYDAVIFATVVLLIFVLVIIIAVFFSISSHQPVEAELKICGTCGRIGHPGVADSGSTLIEIVLWLFAIVPGIFYTFWRKTARRQICSSCGSSELLPLNSPRGLELQARYYPSSQSPEQRGR